MYYIALKSAEQLTEANILSLNKYKNALTGVFIELDIVLYAG